MKLSHLFLLIICISSCATHSGMMTANPDYANSGLEIKKIAIGNASTSRVFGIGGLDKSALVLDAKNNIYRQFPLKKGEAYANVSVDFQHVNLLIYQVTKVTVSADIVGQIDEQSDSEYQKLFQNNSHKISEIINTDNADVSRGRSAGIFRTGDQVFIMYEDTPRKYQVLDDINQKRLLLGTPSENISFKAYYDNIYLAENARLFDIPYKPGDEVLVSIFRKYREARIVGINQKKAIVEITENFEGNQYYEVSYNKIKYQGY